MTRPWWNIDPTADDYPAEQVRLDPIELGVYMNATTSFAVQQGADHFMRDRLRMEMRARVLGQHLPPLTRTVTEALAVDVPATWWQHWKLDHLGSRWAGWVGRRWPVRTRTVTSTAPRVARPARPRAELGSAANPAEREPVTGRWGTEGLVPSCDADGHPFTPGLVDEYRAAVFAGLNGRWWLARWIVWTRVRRYPAIDRGRLYEHMRAVNARRTARRAATQRDVVPGHG